MKIFINVQIVIQLFVLTFAFSAHSQSVQEGRPQIEDGSRSCNSDLEPDFALMLRELGIREKFMVYMSEEDPDVDLLVPLYRIWNFMKRPAFDSMTRMLHSISQIAPEAAERVRENAFFKKYPKFYNQNAVRTFFFLYCHVKAESVSELELGLMAYLFEEQLKAEGAPDGAYWSPYSTYEKRVISLLKQDADRERMFKLMQNKILEDALKVTLAIEQIKMPGTSLATTANRIRSGRENATDREILTYFLISFGNLIARGQSAFPRSITVRYNNRDLMLHNPFVEYMDEWLIKNFPEMSEEERAGQIRMMDYIIFATPPPIKNSVFTSAFIHRAGPLLESAKARYRAYINEQQRIQQEQLLNRPRPQTPSLIFAPASKSTVDDPPAPRVKPPKRRQLPKDEQVAAPVIEQESRPNTLPKALDLARLISPIDGDKFAPLQNLKAMKTYLFFFERESHGGSGKVQRIVFSDEVTTWIKAYPQQGLALLRAIIRGIVKRDEGQNGLRLMHFREKTAFSGSIYEVKTVNDDRVIALPVNGRWQIIEVTTHAKVGARAKIIMPMIEN